MTIAQAMTHARAFLKVGATYASAEEVRFANTVQSIVGSAPWHWNVAAATNINLAIPYQDYTMAAGDQNTVLAVQAGSAYLSNATYTYAPMIVESGYVLPATSQTGRPYGLCLLSPTMLRVFPSPGGSYTMHWRKHKRPTVMAANTETFDCPAAFDSVIKAGMIWQMLDYQDDTRAPEWQKTFYDLLSQLAETEGVTIGRKR